MYTYLHTQRQKPLLCHYIRKQTGLIENHTLDENW